MKVANTKKINERIMQVESIRQAFLMNNKFRLAHMQSTNLTTVMLRRKK